MENYIYYGIVIAIGLMIIYEAYGVIIKQRKINKKMDQLNEDFNIEFRNKGGSISKQRKNYDAQEHQANDDFRFTISEPTTKNDK